MKLFRGTASCEPTLYCVSARSCKVGRGVGGGWTQESLLEVIHGKEISGRTVDGLTGQMEAQKSALRKETLLNQRQLECKMKEGSRQMWDLTVRGNCECFCITRQRLASCPNCHVINKEPASHLTSQMECTLKHSPLLTDIIHWPCTERTRGSS